MSGPTPRVFVTGATGFLGGALTRALVRQGANVVALRRRTSDVSALADVQVTWHEGDLSDRDRLTRQVEGADWIVHAGGMLGRAGVPESAYVEVNVDGTRNLLAAATCSARNARVLHLSSAGVLGPTAIAAGEDEPYGPTNMYERSKAAAERLAIEFAGRGLDVVVARPGFIYGPGDRHVLGLFQAIRRGLFFHIDGGRHLCQPTFVDDAVAGMLACIRHARTGHAYHLVGPRPVSFRELAEAIADKLAVAPPRVSIPRSVAAVAAQALEVVASVARRSAPLSRTGVAFFSEDRVVSWRKARTELGYEPAHDVADGVARTVAWYRDRRWI